MLLMIGMMVIGIALLMVLVWASMRWFERRTNTPTPQDAGFPTSGPTAMEILHQRYARGEMNAAPFEQMHAQLEAAPSAEMQ